MSKLYCLIVVLVVASSFKKVEVPASKLKFNRHYSLKGIPEPSDIYYDSATQHCFIVSDHGKLFECDTNGSIIRKAEKEGLDFEAVAVKDSFVYVSDETPRRIYVYHKRDLSLAHTYDVKCGGAMNQAYESIAYNYSRKCFITISQKPVVIVEYTDDFRELARIRFNGAGDISSATWHDGYLYLLSNLDARIIRCDPKTYRPLEYYNINFFNPEGLTFGNNNSLFVVSDRAGELYTFGTLSIQDNK